jgi:hypothetical protein
MHVFRALFMRDVNLVSAHYNGLVLLGDNAPTTQEVIRCDVCGLGGHWRREAEQMRVLCAWNGVVEESQSQISSEHFGKSFDCFRFVKCISTSSFFFCNLRFIYRSIVYNIVNFTT